MTQELLYTSAPRGLKPGTRGFCTVLSTQGMSAPLATALEGLSGYRPLFPADDAQANRNPVNWSHLRVHVGGQSLHILSRIADYGVDYSQRANKLAHHVVLDRKELVPAGPAAVLALNNFSRTSWEGEPRLVATGPQPQGATSIQGVCRHWQAAMGDAGWAGVIADAFLKDPLRPVILLYQPGQEILPLFAEAISLLPPEKRWEVTFSTYFTGLAAGTQCAWRAMIHDSKEAHESLRFVNALRIDLTKPAPTQQQSELITAARTGHRPQVPQPAEVEAVYTPEEATPTTEGQPLLPRQAGKTEPGAYSLQHPASPTLPGLPELKGKIVPTNRTSGGLWKTVTAIALLLLTVIGGGGAYYVYILNATATSREGIAAISSDANDPNVEADQNKTLKPDVTIENTPQNEPKKKDTAEVTPAVTASATVLPEVGGAEMVKNTPAPVDKQDKEKPPLESPNKESNNQFHELHVHSDVFPTAKTILAQIPAITHTETSDHSITLLCPAWEKQLSLGNFEKNQNRIKYKLKLKTENTSEYIADIILSSNGELSLTPDNNQLNSETWERIRWCSFLISRTTPADRNTFESHALVHLAKQQPVRSSPFVITNSASKFESDLVIPSGVNPVFIASEIDFKSQASEQKPVNFSSKTHYNLDVNNPRVELHLESKVLLLDAIKRDGFNETPFLLHINFTKQDEGRFYVSIDSTYRIWRDQVEAHIKDRRAKLNIKFGVLKSALKSDTDGTDDIFSKDFFDLCEKPVWALNGDPKEDDVFKKALEISNRCGENGGLFKHTSIRMKEKKDAKNVEEAASNYFNSLSKFLAACIEISDVQRTVSDLALNGCNISYDLFHSKSKTSSKFKRAIVAIPDQSSAGGQP